MTDHIDRVREQAESEAERLWPTYPNGEAARITDPACWVKRKAYVRGQVALASRLTRENIAEALTPRARAWIWDDHSQDELTNKQWRQKDRWRKNYETQADAVLALLANSNE